MASSIAEQLSQVPLVSTVLRTDFDLLEASPTYDDARLLLRGWVEKKLRIFTSERVDWSKPYERLTLNETLLEFAQSQDVFTFTLSHPDSKQRHVREWITEVCLNAETGNRAYYLGLASSSRVTRKSHFRVLPVFSANL